jgi:hypothetical protein
MISAQTEKSFKISESLKNSLLIYIRSSKSDFLFADVQQLFDAIIKAEVIPDGNNVEDHK